MVKSGGNLQWLPSSGGGQKHGYRERISRLVDERAVALWVLEGDLRLLVSWAALYGANELEGVGYGAE